MCTVHPANQSLHSQQAALPGWSHIPCTKALPPAEMLKQPWSKRPMHSWRAQGATEEHIQPHPAFLTWTASRFRLPIPSEFHQHTPLPRQCSCIPDSILLFLYFSSLRPVWTTAYGSLASLQNTRLPEPQFNSLTGTSLQNSRSEFPTTV